MSGFVFLKVFGCSEGDGLGVGVGSQKQESQRITFYLLLQDSEEFLFSHIVLEVVRAVRSLSAGVSQAV